MSKIISWSVGDFKALAHARLEVSSLTILTGANSSGKSSLLQSLLLLGQSVGRAPNIVLNGPLVRLGRPVDVVRRDQKNIELGFRIAPDGAYARQVVADVSISLGVDAENNTLVPTAFQVVDAETGTTLLAATASRLSISDADTLRHKEAADVQVLRISTIAGRKAPNRMYVLFVGFVPTSLALHRDPDSIDRTMRLALADYLAAERFPYETLFELNRLVNKDKFLRRIRGVDAEKERSTSGRWTAKDILALSQRELDEFVTAAADARSSTEWAVFGPDSYRYGVVNSGGLVSRLDGPVEAHAAAEHESSLDMVAAISDALTKFASEIRYLGPLRDEPRVVHGAWDERVRALPVGIKGELTAEVLTRRKDESVSYRDWNGKGTRRSLPGAVADWCSYFGLGDYIKILDHGKLGRGVELRVNGVYRDLTTIGVGASQLLPVLVAGLGAAPGSVLLIEQPELHLHPQVQSRLADFFLRARPDVRFIVETHSEYFITRVRRRVAEQKAANSSVQVMFAEQHEGITSVRRLNLDEMGDFGEWPKGFFDAQDEDSLGIVAAIARRAGLKTGQTDLE